MFNRNATRHLLLVVSILLCAFLYAGYTLSRRSGDSPADPEPPAAAPGGAGRLRPEAGNGAAARVPPGSGEGLSLAPPAAAPAPAVAAPPSGAGAMTGLVPETAGADAAASRGTSLPLPGFSDSPDAEESAPPPVLALPGMESGSDGAGNGFSYDETGEAEEGDFAALPGFDAQEESSPPPVLTPPAAAQPRNAPQPAAAALAPPPVSANPPAEAGTGTALRPPPRAGSDSAPAAQTARQAAPPSSPPPSATPPSGGEARAVETDSLRIYVVAPGDTLSSIAMRELGSGFLADNIFLLNRDVIDDPNQLTVGVKIRLPYAHSNPAADPSGAPSAPALSSGGETARRPTQGLGTTHTVERGDTLSSIALRYYGTSAGWRFLYEANRAIVPNPNQLSVGMELTIPPYEP